MASYKITSDITVLGPGKTKMDVEFYDNSDVLINSESGYEIDADTDAGIKLALSRAAIYRASGVSVAPPSITVEKDTLIQASLVEEAAA